MGLKGVGLTVREERTGRRDKENQHLKSMPCDKQIEGGKIDQLR
jgi:hypothetical protein